MNSGVLIDNEITRYHPRVTTMKEAINFWRKAFRRPLLKQWLERDSSAADSIKITHNMLTDAVPYEVMLGKMLRAVPTESERLELVSERDKKEKTLLHRVAQAGNPDSIEFILSLYPESERKHVVNIQDQYGTVLHAAAYSEHPESLKTVLRMYPESECLQAVRMPDHYGRTVLHHVTNSGKVECLKHLLTLYPESERAHAVSIPDRDGWTVLHCAVRLGNLESIEALLAVYPESDGLQALNS